MEDTVTTGGGEGAPEEPGDAIPDAAAQGSAPQQPTDVSEPVLGGPKDDPQEAIAAHSGMWWPPTVETEPGASSEPPADAVREPPPPESPAP